MAADPSVLELQQLLVKHGYMTQEQLNTGPGTLGARTRAALTRVLDGKEPGSAGSPTVPKSTPKKSPQAPKDTPHDTWFYIVQGVDSLESLARQWGVSVGNLLSLSDNHSLQQQQKKGKVALKAGDRVAVPSHVQTKVQKTPSSQQDTSLFGSMVDYLLHLTDEHPASQDRGAKPQQGQVAKKATKATAAQVKHPPANALPTQGYTKKHPRIWPKVVLNKPIESAFLVLLPYLPQATVMTSGYRSDADQERIINDYYDQHHGNPLEKNVEKRRLWLKTEKKLIIAKVGSSPHRTGYAFDLSGSKLASIEAAVKKCAKEQGDKFPLLNYIVERNQNCLHVNLKPTATRPA